MNDTNFRMALPADLKEAAGLAAESHGLSLAGYFRRAVKLAMARDREDEDRPRRAVVRDSHRFGGAAV